MADKYHIWHGQPCEITLNYNAMLQHGGSYPTFKEAASSDFMRGYTPIKITRETDGFHQEVWPAFEDYLPGFWRDM